jgi:uncharacterized protein with PIN domain
LKQKKKQQKPAKKLPDFSVDDIINAPKPKAAMKQVAASGCPHCGGLRFVSKDEVKVFRGQRMKVYHCHGCGQDFYKEE